MSTNLSSLPNVVRLRWLSGLLALALLAGALAAIPAWTARAATTYTVFTSTTVPKVPMDSDTVPIELGMKFQVNADSFATGVKFYKGRNNTGTHTGSLWDASQNRLATVTFTGETTSGWQSATFAAPVKLVPNQTYVVSYYAPVGRYSADANGFATAKTNGPLTGLADGADGGNGVYRYGTGGGFPNGSFQATNYYVDVVVSSDSTDTSPPTVIGQTPSAGATGVAVTSGASATFNEAVQSATVGMTLTAGTTTVAGTKSYDASSKTVTFTPTANLTPSTTYTAKVSGAKDTAGNTMTDVSWTFTTSASTSACPCTIWPNSTVPSVTAANDDSAVELGVRFRANKAGYITGLRFYKGSGNNGTHLGSLWSGDGSTKLRGVTFVGESATGWQTATFSAPVPIQANTTYVASYYAPVGRYAATSNGLSAAVANGPLTALASGTDGVNGLYGYGGSAFPSNMYQKSNYWVDVVFDTNVTDTTPPTLTSQVPAPNSSGAPVNGGISATFSEPVDGTSVAMEVRDQNNALVAGTVAYDTPSQKATFTPSAPLANSTTYTVKVSGAKDGSNNVMTPVTWSFTSAAPAPPGPDQGPGGPIAVVTSASNKYATFLAEILRTEGLNEFSTIDVSTLSASTLASYDTVVLGAVPVSAAQASALETWVNGGGNLIALKPSATLSNLLGITAGSGSLSDAYLKVDTTTAPGAGIVADSIQFHGPADRYTANTGTQSVAALWSSATVATANPAVTLRAVGTSGGHAAAFTYDLARSIALMRQGNIDWAGTERDGNGTIRSDDYFFGGSSADDWVNLNKVAIPQADEQQRLLANVIQLVNRDRKPLPRFWYFPNTVGANPATVNLTKAVLVGTGDDHANNGTAGRFDQMIANSPSGCAGTDQAAATLLANWSCLRYSSYLWNGTPLSNAAATAYDAKGFEIGLHVNTGGGNYTSSSIFDIYAEQMAGFKSKYTTLPNPQTTRMHAIVFSDWASQPKAEIANGMRMDTNYYYWPGSWVQDRPGFMTGSGMAMRFTDTDGSLIDNFQAATQMTDESDQSYPSTVNTLVDNAIGAKGYYGSFVANMHTDQSTEPQSDALIAAAQSRGVPLISSRQLLTWLDGRNASSYSNIAWASNQLSFKVNVGTGANNLLGMVPTAGPNGTTLTKLTKTGTGAVTYSALTVKGLEYATFVAGSGSYVATYGGGTASAADAGTTGTNARMANAAEAKTIAASAPSVSAATLDAVAAKTGETVQALPTTADARTVRWTTKANTTTKLLLGTSPTKLATAYSLGEATRRHSATVTGLKPKTTYYYRVASTDTTGVTTLSPAASAAPASFTTDPADITAPVLDKAPEVTALPDGTAQVSWSTSEATSSVVTTGAVATSLTQPVIDSDATTDHTVLLTDLEPGKTYFLSTKSADAAGNKLVTAPTKFVTPNYGVGQALAPSFRTGNANGNVSVALKKLGLLTLKGKPGTAQTGTYTSKPLDAMAMVDWDRAVVSQDVPSGGTVTISYRSGSTSSPDKSWSAWTTLGSDLKVSGSGRYLQYRVELSATATATSLPSVSAIGFSSNGQRPVLEGEVGPR